MKKSKASAKKAPPVNPAQQPVNPGAAAQAMAMLNEQNTAPNPSADPYAPSMAPTNGG